MNKIILIILIISLVVLSVILYKHININSELELELFTTPSSQNGNLLKIINSSNSSLQNITNSIGEPIKLIEAPLDGLYNITDITITGIEGKLRIGINNKSKNEINYVSFDDSAINITDKIKLDKSSSSLPHTSNNIRNPFGNIIIGDSIKIFLLDEQDITNLNILICGVLSTETVTKKELYTLYTDAKILNTTANNQSLLETNNTSNLSNILSTDKLYKITSIEITNTDIYNKELTISYTNNYTNEVMIYKSERENGTFIVSNNFKNIYLYENILLVNRLAIYYKNDTDNNVYLKNDDCVIRGYLASKNDVTAFKLQNSLTDIRGSINPDDVCPGIDGLINSQLSAEVIIDSLDYQEKVKDEKVKLNSNKEALLHLLEQKEKISSVGAMIDKIEELQERRNMETDALNAIRLNKQIDEINKLKEVLDARIKQNEKNTYNFDKIRVNNIKRLDTSSSGEDIPDVEAFTDLPNEEKMYLA